ncbi:MAG: DUF3572 family protein [Albidovulum sp.]|nr:DUF3572 family protein [Albidovulum sp.]
MRQEEAEIVAIKAVEWLVGADERLLSRFFSTTGATADDFKRVAEDIDFMATVLEFILAQDETVLEFCEHADLPNDAPRLARGAMPGGNTPHWT